MLTSGFDYCSDFILCEEFLVDQVLELWQGLLSQQRVGFTEPVRV
jgi:hypothetical protein